MLRILIVLFIFVACTDKKEEASVADDANSDEVTATTAQTPPAAQKVEPAEPWVILPDIPGMDLSYQKASEEDGHFRITGLEIVEASASYPIDDFPEEVWGPLLVKIRDKEFDIVFTDENKDFQVTYHSPTKENIKTKGLCKWKGGKPEPKTKEMSITSMDSTVLKRIVVAAESGNKIAFDAIMATEVTKAMPKDFAAAQTRLKYMKSHGCTWK